MQANDELNEWLMIHNIKDPPSITMRPFHLRFTSGVDLQHPHIRGIFCNQSTCVLQFWQDFESEAAASTAINSGPLDIAQRNRYLFATKYNFCSGMSGLYLGLLALIGWLGSMDMAEAMARSFGGAAFNSCPIGDVKQDFEPEKVRNTKNTLNFKESVFLGE